MNKKVGVGLIGSQFIASIHADSFQKIKDAELIAVMEILFAAYASAGTGKKVELPFKTDAAKPYDLWKK